MTELEEITDLERLRKAFKEVRSVSAWKTSTQRYEANVTLNNLYLQNEARTGMYKQSPMLDFTLNERGKIRDIHAPAVRDRVLQKVINQDVLLPCLRKYLIYDNSASLMYRGTSFARKRHLIHLRNFIRNYGKDGYILQIDIKRYFDSIDHEICWKMIEPKIPDSTKPIIKYIIENASDSNKGLNLGSEVPQTLAVYYLHPVDNYCKIKRGIKYYGRYMDDIYIFGTDKAELRKILDEIRKQLTTLKLKLNEKKTQIVKITHGYMYMQLKYKVLESGKVVISPAPVKITRERRKLKAYKRLYDKGKITELEILCAYRSWKGAILSDCSCYKSINNLDELYIELFKKSPDRSICFKIKRSDILNSEGIKHFILRDNPFTKRIGNYI